MSVRSNAQDIRVTLEESGSVQSSFVIKDKEDRTWKSYFSDSSSSSILQPGEDCTVGSLGFLYDYYGMTEDTQHGPPSPVSSDVTVVQPSSPAIEEFDKTVDAVTSVATELSESVNDRDDKDDNRVNTSPGHRSNSCSPETNIPEIENNEVQDGISAVKSELSPIPTTSHANRIPITITIMYKTYLAFIDFPFQTSQFHPNSYSTIFQAEDQYVYILKAQTSRIQKQGDNSLTYLNKGQFYKIMFECNIPNQSEYGNVKSILHLVFHGEKDPKNELINWHYWHSQQVNSSQRVFDVDRKSCVNVNEVEFCGYNAVSFVWNRESKAEVAIRVNCLSTDFSSQKGVKGIPLHFLIDTHEDPAVNNIEPVHRCFCQVKIFRDKGAERKNKDESKFAEKRIVKFIKQSSGPLPNPVSSIFQCQSEVTKLIPTTTLGPKPVVYSPPTNGEVLPTTPPSSYQSSSLLTQLREKETKRTLTAALAVAKDDLQDLSMLPRYKNPRVTEKQAPAVTIYVRKQEEKVYNALILFDLHVTELKESLASKYGMPAEMIKNLYKKTRKGILVNLDDAMLAQFVDEDDFIIEVTFDNQLGHFEITFIY